VFGSHAGFPERSRFCQAGRTVGRVCSSGPAGSHLAVERVLLDPMKAAVHQQQLVAIQKFKLHVKPVAVHLAVERQLVPWLVRYRHP
jgi:hypothetical protein